MTLFTVLAYLFLIMASGIQSGFKKVFESELSPLNMLAPRYYYTWIRSLPMISGVIVGFYPLYLISPFQIHWGVLLCLHLILVVFLGAILQVIYMNAIGYSPNSGKHVFRIMILGYLMIVINLFTERQKSENTSNDQSIKQENYKSIDASESTYNPVDDNNSEYQKESTSLIQEYEDDHKTKDTAGMSALDKSKGDWSEDFKKYNNEAGAGRSYSFSPEDDKNK